LVWIVNALFDYLMGPNANNAELRMIAEEFLKDISGENHDEVTPRQFKNFLHWFGPLRMDELLRQPWFFGTTPAQEADTILASCPDSYFLVRMNTGVTKPIEESPFTIVRKHSPQPEHIRIYPKRDNMDIGHQVSYIPSGFYVEFFYNHRGNSQNQEKTLKKLETRSPNLEDFITQLQIQELTIFTNDLSRLQRSKYHHILNHNPRATRYVDQTRL